MKKILFLMLLIVAFAVVPVHADPVTVGDPLWYEFGFGLAGTFATDGAGTTPSTGGNSQFAPDPPWTYNTVFPIGSQVTIVDAFLKGDIFTLYDFGVPVGSTTLVPNLGTGTETDPDLALLDFGYSRGTFGLGAGAHSLTIQVALNALDSTGGAAYFRVDPCGIPVPPTVYLLGTSLLGLVGLRFRRNLG
jgi:hypothetical protein